MEPITTVGAGLAVLGSKDLLNKLLGPSADYIGGEIQGVIEKCNINLDNIFKKATVKSGNRLEEKLTVNPRILKHIVDEGRFCEEELTAEYYGGILASSRSEVGRDDRGMALLSTLKDLSTYQIRTHYLIYYLINNIFKNKEIELGDVNQCRKLLIHIPFYVFETAMDFDPKENTNGIMAHVLFGLSKFNLISDNFTGGSLEHLKKQHPKATIDGIVVAPSLHGAELFLWALGKHGASGLELLKEDIGEPLENISIIEGSIAV